MDTQRTTTALAAAVLTAVLGSTAAASPALASEAAPSGWTQADFDGAASRANPAVTQLTAGTVGGARHLRDLAAGSYGGSLSSSVISGGKVYAVRDGQLARYDETTGRRDWSRTVSDPDASDGTSVYGTVTVVRGLVLVPVSVPWQDPGARGTTRVYSARTGAPLGSRDGTVLGTDGTTAVYEVWHECWSDCGQPARTATVEVRDVASDAVLHQLDRYDGYGAYPKVLFVHGLLIYQGTDDARTVRAVDPRTGTTAWTRAGSSLVLSRGDASSVKGQHLYAVDTSGAGSVLDLDPSTGRTRSTLTGAHDVLAVDATRVYADCGTSLCTFTRATGTASWTRPGSRLAVAVGGDAVYLGDGTVLRAGTGAKVARIWGTTTTSFAVGNGVVTADLGHDRLELFGLPSGSGH